MNLGDKFKSLGIEVKEVDKAEALKSKNKVSDKPVMLVGESLNKSLIEGALVPAKYIDLEFDPSAIKEELIKEWARTKRYTIKNFQDYISTLSGILTTLRMGQVPDRSYLIGFSSNTPLANMAFAVTAIKLMYAHGMNVVPFVHCTDLCGVMNLENHRLSGDGPLRNLEYSVYTAAKEYDRFTLGSDALVKAVANECLKKINTDNIDESENIGYKLSRSSEATTLQGMMRKQPVFYRTAASRFSWSEYINADLLICWVGIDSQREAESKALYGVMKARAAQGKPTICFIGTSLDIYTSDHSLYANYWCEMEDIQDNSPRYNRFTHISCYKMYSTLGKVSSGIDDKRT